MTQKLTIVSRESELAMWQALHVQQKLQQLYPTLEIVIKGVTTKGDKLLETSLAKIGGKGLFVKELEQQLLEKKADIAVHSLKDMPYQLPAGLGIVTVMEREDVRDVLVAADKNIDFHSLPQAAVIGTSSLRRQAQILATRPDLTIKVLRGNVQTRLKKLKQKQYDAIILAAAGLKRLQLESEISSYFDIATMIPAVGQGALAIECRADDVLTQKLLQPLNHISTWQQIAAERAMNVELKGSCQVPIAGHATINNNQITVVGMVGHPSGSPVFKATATGKLQQAAKVGVEVAKKLKSQGADSIIEEFN